MMRRPFVSWAGSVLFLCLSATILWAADPDPRELIQQSVDAMGGRAAFYAKEGVRYTYTYRQSSGKKDVSIETYRFRDELSQATYTHRDLLFPELKGKLVQIYDGKFTRTFLDGNAVTKPEVAARSDFLRKTNFYWLSMMFKLLDPGVIHTYAGQQTVGGIDYEKVKIGFEDGIGDVKDTYMVYIHPETKRIDFFLFTVMAFGIDQPLLMKVEYETIAGILLPTKRKYIKASDWETRHDPDGEWIFAISTNIEFGNFIQ